MIVVWSSRDIVGGRQVGRQAGGGRIHLLCVSTVQHAQYGEIERGSGISEENFQVAVVEGGKASQRRFLQGLDVSKFSGNETNLMGNQY